MADRPSTNPHKSTKPNKDTASISGSIKSTGTKRDNAKTKMANPITDQQPKEEQHLSIPQAAAKDHSSLIKSPSANSGKSKNTLREKVLKEKIRKASISISESEFKYGTPESKLDLDPLMTESDLPGLGAEFDDCASFNTDLSINSNRSRQSMMPVHFKKGAGVAMDEATKLANDTYQRGKLALEEAGNMKRECKATAYECLQTLYETALALSDSRSRHKYNLERERSRNALELVRVERAHNKEIANLKHSLSDHVLKNQEILQTTLEQTNNIKNWLNYEVSGPIQSIVAIKTELIKIKDMRVQPKGKTGEEGQETINCIEAILKVENNIKTVSNQVNSLRIDLENLTDRLGKLTERLTLEPVSTPCRSTPPETEKEELEGLQTENKTKLETISKDIADLKEMLTQATKQEQVNKEHLPMDKDIQNLKSLIKEAIMPYGLIQEDLRYVRSDIKQAIDTVAEIAAPVRMAIEEVRNIHRESSTSVDTWHLKDKETQPESPTPIQPNQNVTQNTVKFHQQTNAAKIPTYTPTYATVAARPRFSLVIESQNPEHTSADVINSIKSNVDVIELGIGINQMRGTRNRKVVIGCDNDPDRKILGSALTSRVKSLSVTQPKLKLPQIRLNGVINELTNQQIEKAVIKQNGRLLKDIPEEAHKVKVLRRTKGRKRETCGVIMELEPITWKTLVGQKLKIGYQMITVADQSPVVQCFRCLKFGHLARECQASMVCGYCSEPHETRECHRTSQAKCNNCKTAKQNNSTDHPAYSSDCPIWRKWDAIARSSVDYNC